VSERASVSGRAAAGGTGGADTANLGGEWIGVGCACSFADRDARLRRSSSSPIWIFARGEEDESQTTR